MATAVTWSIFTLLHLPGRKDMPNAPPWSSILGIAAMNAAAFGILGCLLNSGISGIIASPALSVPYLLLFAFTTAVHVFLNTKKASKAKLDEMWDEALSKTASKLNLGSEEILVERLRKFDKPAHSTFRYILSQLVALELGASGDMVERVWLFGSVNGSEDNIGPVSDIDLLMEVDSDAKKVKTSKAIASMNIHFTKKFNLIMADTGIRITELIDTINKLLLPDEIEERKGFAALIKPLYDLPASLLFDRKKVPDASAESTAKKGPPSILEAAEIHIKEAAATMELDKSIKKILLKPKRVTTVKFEIELDDGDMVTFWAFRALQNDARGTGKGGLRWLVGMGETLEEAKETAVGLATLMSVKNAVIGIPYGGGKGDVFVEDREYTLNDKARIMRAFSRKLTLKRAVGTFIDVPAPDKGTGAEMMACFADEHLKILAEKRQLRDREIQRTLRRLNPPDNPRDTPYLDEALRILSEDKEGVRQCPEIGVVTGKPVGKGGSKGRTKATGFGGFLTLKTMLRYFSSVNDMDRDNIGKRLNEKTKAVLRKPVQEMTAGIQGGGNVGEYNAWEFYNAGTKITLLQDAVPEDVNGKTEYVSYTLYNPSGINLELLDQYLARMPDGRWEPFKNVSQEFLNRTGTRLIRSDKKLFWTYHTDIKVAAATENVITSENAESVNCEILLELANCPITPEADKILMKKGILIIPDVLANAGGVTVSYFEWLQNIEGRYWSEISVDKMLEERMSVETQSVIDIAKKYDVDLRQAAFILSLARIANAEIARNRILRFALWFKKVFKSQKPYEGYGELGLYPETVEELKEIRKKDGFKELIARDEARHKKKIDAYVNSVKEKFSDQQRGFVLVGGPTTSGKIAFSERIADKLRSEMPSRKVTMLDIDLYLDGLAEDMAGPEYSEETIYRKRLEETVRLMKELLEGRETGIYVMKDGRLTRDKLKLEKNEILVIEGNYLQTPEMLDKKIGVLKGEQIFSIFVNTAPSLKLAKNRPLTSLDLRFMRHILTFTGIFNKDPLEIIRKWSTERELSLKYTYPTWKNADVTFNSYLSYELPVLKLYIKPILKRALREARGERDQVSIKAIKHLLLILKGVRAVDMSGDIPDDSIIR
ncbi:MAG: hypothetical protein HQ579_03345, partial [Candidatus Omnitrophica bacterium]|nr:hypothetical protein [Candidatus Omnitrophota bacterium]